MTFAIAFAVYTLFIVLVGLYSAKYAKRSDEDYFLAGRSLGPWVAAISASASSESGWVTLGLVGLGFTTGYAAYWIIPGCLLGFIFNWFFLAARMRDRSASLGALTLPDFFAFNFRERLPILRIITVIVILAAMWLYVAAQFAAAGKTFHAAFPDLLAEWFPNHEYQAGLIIGAVIVLFYTVVGGFRAACWTDFVQGIIMVGTLVVFPLFLLPGAAGGYDFIAERLATIEDGRLLEFTPAHGWLAVLGFLLGSHALGINFGYPGMPHVLARFMALRDRRQAYMCGVVAVVWAGFVYWGAATVGIIARAMTVGLGDGDPTWLVGLAAEVGSTGAGETALVLTAKHLVPGILSGMVLAAVLAAICSTADSQLVVAASAGANDLYSRLIDKSGKTAHMVVNRVVLAVIGVGAVALVYNSDAINIFDFVLSNGWALLGAAFGPQVILVLLWRRASYAGCIAGMLTGAAVVFIWKFTYMDYRAANPDADLPEVYNLPVAFICALIVNVIVSMVVPSRQAESGTEQASA